MKPVVARAAAAGLLATLAAGLVQWILVGRADPRLGYWLLVAIVGGLVVRSIATVALQPTDTRLRPLFRRPSSEPELGLPASLRRAERLIRHGPRDAYTASHRLLPTLRGLAEERLLNAHGISIDNPAARSLLGDDAWNLITPSWGNQRAPNSPGPEFEELASLVEAIERIR